MVLTIRGGQVRSWYRYFIITVRLRNRQPPGLWFIIGWRLLGNALAIFRAIKLLIRHFVRVIQISITIWINWKILSSLTDLVSGHFLAKLWEHFEYLKQILFWPTPCGVNVKCNKLWWLCVPLFEKLITTCHSSS